MKELNEKIYKEIIADAYENISLKCDNPVVIKFGTEWCAPCKRLKPTFKALSEEYAGKVDMYDVDAEDNPILASGFGVQSVPTIIFIPKTGKTKILTGALPQPLLKKEIDNILS